MWLKILGALMILGAGTWIGFSFAARYEERPRQIGQLISCLTALRACVNYNAMPLPEALIHSGDSVDGPVKEMFQRTGNILSDSGWISAKQAIEKVLQDMKIKLALDKPEKELLLQLGGNLGFTNREEQEKYLTMVLGELGRVENDSCLKRDKNVKMYRYLGICGGLTLIILLV